MLSQLVAIRTSAIDDESRAASPDTGRIARLRAERDAYITRQRELRADDLEVVRDVLATLGPQVQAGRDHRP